MPNKKDESESKTNYQQVSAENFEQEMTLVYLMLKGEYSQQKVVDNMDNLAINKAMLSPFCKVFPKKIEVDDEPVKVPISVIEHCNDMDSGSLLMSVEKIKIAVPPLSRSSLEIKDIEACKSIDKKSIGIVDVKPPDIQVELKVGECNSVSVPSVQNMEREISRLNSIVPYKAAEIIIVKPIDIQVEQKEIESNHVVVSTMLDLSRKTSKLNPVVAYKVTGVITTKFADIKVKLKGVECNYVFVPTMLELSKKIGRLSPVAAHKVTRAAGTKAKDIRVELRGVEYIKMLMPPILKLGNIKKSAFSIYEEKDIAIVSINPYDVILDSRIYSNEVKVNIQSMPDILSIWETMGGSANLIRDYEEIEANGDIPWIKN